MRKSTFLGTVFTAALVTGALMSTGSAMAACTHTEWVNIVPNHPLPMITERNCDGDLGVNVVGSDPQGQTFEFGWAPATRIDADSISSVFVDANATNSIQMDAIAQLNSMRATINTQITGGASTEWTADYVLSRTY